VTDDHTDHPPLESHGPVEERQHPPVRLIALSDGIFAIAATLLALEIQVPEDVADDAEFGQEVLTFLSSLGVFVVAFLITVQFWLAHHRALSYVHTLDRRSLADGAFALLGVAALPAASRLIVGESHHWQALVAAAGILAATSLLTIRFYARVLRPEYAEITARERRQILTSSSTNLAIYLLTIVAVLVLHATGARPEAAFALWLLLPLSRGASRWLAGHRATD
jgi:uncharacterized membrane protein